MEPPNPGQLIAERYRLIREVGLGGMGSVWLAYDETLASRCALKLLHPGPDREEEFAIRLECEAKCAAQLRSPHVVDVLNRGTWHGKPFIVMEYLEGEDLAARLERVGRLDATTTYRIVAQVARALTRAHALGIVHRDIKPANIFLVPGEDHEVAKVLDFGIAKHRALPNAFENPGEAWFIGTPCYMSPEQARGQCIDQLCDLWALAVITFECLTGSLPFPDESVPSVLAAVLESDMPALTADRPDLPEAVEAWWRRATAKRPSERFRSAREFADALGEALDFPKVPISRPSRLGAAATTLLGPCNWARPSTPPPAQPDVRARAHGTPHNTSLTLHDAGLLVKGERARRSRRRGRWLMPAAAAAVCATLGFAASSLRAEVDWTSLFRERAAVPAAPTVHAATAAELAQPADRAPELAPAAAPILVPPPALVPVAVASPRSLPPPTPGMQRASAVPKIIAQPDFAQARVGNEPRGSEFHPVLVDVGVMAEPRPSGLRSASDPFTTSLDDNAPAEAAPGGAKAQRAKHSPALDAEDPEPRPMPPGEKDYGI